MQGIDTPDATGTLPPAPASLGPGKFFQKPDFENFIDPTLVPYWWFNSIQQEILNVIQATGSTPNKNNLGQMLTAIQALIAQETNARQQAVASEQQARQNGDTSVMTFAAQVGFAVVESSSNGSFTVPPNVGGLEIWATGGGAGGGACRATSSAYSYKQGAGGGAGATSHQGIAVASGDVISWTIGLGGAGGTSPNANACYPGAAGTDTIIYKNGTEVFRAGGGFAGIHTDTGTAIYTGGGRGGNGNVDGGDGGDGQANTKFLSAYGGASFWGGGSKASDGAAAANQNAQANGAGGGAAFDSAESGTGYSGSSGANGRVVIRY